MVNGLCITVIVGHGVSRIEQWVMLYMLLAAYDTTSLCFLLHDAQSLAFLTAVEDQLLNAILGSDSPLL